MFSGTPEQIDNTPSSHKEKKDSCLAAHCVRASRVMDYEHLDFIENKGKGELATAG